MKRKKIKLLLFTGIIILFSSCATNEYRKLRIEIPEKAVVNLDDFQEIIITDFFVEKEPDDININKELKDYFAFELKKNIEKTVSQKDLAIENEESFKNEDFWKQALPEKTETLVLTGKAQYSQEVRKALLEREKKQQETPFSSELKLAQRKFYTLILDIYLIDVQTGKIIFQRKFDETKNYENPNQTAYFAFFDLIQNVKKKFFRNILGEEKLQERYLILN